MELEEGEIEDGEIYEDGPLSNPSVPGGFWTRFVPNRHQKNRGREYQGKQNLSRKFSTPARSSAGVYKERGFHTHRRSQNEPKRYDSKARGNPKLTFLRTRRGRRQLPYRRDREFPAGASGITRTEHATSDPTLDVTSDFGQYYGERDEGHFGGRDNFNAEKEEHYRKELTEVRRLCETEEKLHAEGYDSDEYDVLVQRYHLIKNWLGRLQGGEMPEVKHATRRHEPSQQNVFDDYTSNQHLNNKNWRDFEDNQHADYIPDNIQMRDSPYNSFCNDTIQMECRDVRTFNDKRNLIVDNDETTRHSYGMPYHRQSFIADGVPVWNSHEKTQHLWEPPPANNDDSYYSEFQNMSTYREERNYNVDFCIGDSFESRLPQNDKRNVFQGALEGSYAMSGNEAQPMNEVATSDKKSRNLPEQFAPPSYIQTQNLNKYKEQESENTERTPSQTEDGSKSLIMPFHVKFTLKKKSLPRSITVLNSDLNLPVVSTQEAEKDTVKPVPPKKKKKGKSKKINKNKKKAKVAKLQPKSKGSHADVKKGETAPDYDGVVGLENFISSCRMESLNCKDNGTVTAKLPGDDYQTVPMDLCDYSSEDKTMSPKCEVEKVFSKTALCRTEQTSCDENDDEQLLREQLLRSVAFKRLEKAKQLVAMNKQTQEHSVVNSGKTVAITKRMKSTNDKKDGSKKNDVPELEESDLDEIRRTVTSPEPTLGESSPCSKAIYPNEVSKPVTTIKSPESGFLSHTILSQTDVVTIVASNKNNIQLNAKDVIGRETAVSSVVAKPLSPALLTPGKDSGKITVLNKKCDVANLKMPKHDPVVIQVGAESDSEDEEEDAATREHVDEFLQTVKGELQALEPGATVSNMDGTNKQNQVGSSFALTDAVLLGLQKTIKDSKSVLHRLNDDVKLDEDHLELLMSDIAAKESKVEEQDTKIAKIFQQLLAARKLKKILSNSLQDTKQKAEDFKKSMTTKENKRKGILGELSRGEKLLALAKKELLRERLQKMRDGDIGSPVGSDTSENSVETDKRSEGETSVNTENFAKKSRFLYLNVQRIKNKLVQLTSSLQNLERPKDAKIIGLKRRSTEHNPLVVKKKAKKIVVSMTKKPLSNNAAEFSEEIEKEKARLIKLERELRKELMRFQSKVALTNDRPLHPSSQSPVKVLPPREKQASNEGSTPVEQLKNVANILPAIAQPVEKSLEHLLQDNEKIERLQDILMERLELSKRAPLTVPSFSVHKIPITVPSRARFGFQGNKVGSTDQTRAEEDKQEECLTPFASYRSVLPMFKSYRLCPFFRSKENRKLSSNTFSNKVNAKEVICPFDLDGKCLDEDCQRQHGSIVFKLTLKELLQDLARYDATKRAKSRDCKLSKDAIEYIDSFVLQYESKFTDDEIGVLFLNEIKKVYSHSDLSKQTYIIFKSNSDNEESQAINEGKGSDLEEGDLVMRRTSYTITAQKPRKDQNKTIHNDVEAPESQEVRYFAESYNCERQLEDLLEQQPYEIPLWLALSTFYLQENDNDSVLGDGNRDKALNALSRGLDLNPDSEELWIHYLSLFAKGRDYDSIQSTCFRAHECVSSFKVNWLCLELLETYADKKKLCLSMLSNLCNSAASSKLDTSETANTSHQIVETLSYLVSLHVACGKHRTAVNYCLQCLGYDVTGGEEALVPLRDVLTNCDKCLLWLICINVCQQKELPPLLFDRRMAGLSRLVSLEPFIIHFEDAMTIGMRQESRKYLKAAMKCICSVEDPTCMGFCHSVVENFLQFEFLASEKPELNQLTGQVANLLHRYPKLSSCFFLTKTSDISEKEVVQLAEELFVSSSFHDEVVFHYSSWLYKMEKYSLLEDTVRKYILSKYSIDTRRSVPSDVDTVVLFRRLLGQPVGLLGRLPDVMKPCDSTSKEYLYSWLNFCLYLDVIDGPKANSERVIAAYESAITSYTTTLIRKALWIHYLQYLLKHLQEGDSRAFAFIMESLQRAIVSVPTNEPLPMDNSQCRDNFDFQNEAVELCSKAILPTSMPDFYKLMLELMPDNVELGTKVCQYEFERGNIEQARRLYASMLPIAPRFLSLWKVAISIEASKKCFKEVRWLYQEAVKSVPFSSSLWKEYALFEIAHGKDSKTKETTLKGIFKASSQYGVEVEGFVKNVVR